MKKICWLIFLFPTFYYSQQVQIKNFNDLFLELKSGNNLKAIIHYAKAKLIIDGKEETAPNAIGGMELKTFEYFAKGSVRNEKAFISSSETVLISHPRYGYVLNYVKQRIFDDNSVEIVARYLDPKNYSVVMDEIFYSTINDGINDGALYLYIN